MDAPPPPWALEQAASELARGDDPAELTERAWELVRGAQERADEQHDEYDDPDQGGEA
jgi:hypothetical protein